MQKTFKNQQGREFLMLDLPSDARDISVSIGVVNHVEYSCDIYLDGETVVWATFTQGNYQILCLAKDIDADKLLELGLAEKIGLSWNLKTIYSKVPNSDFEKAATTSYKESLTSLITSLGFKQDDNVLILEKV